MMFKVKNKLQRSLKQRCGVAKRSSRKGAAVVELAICTPVIILVSVALIELGTLIFLKQGLAVAAYEAGHRGVQPAATSNDALNAANEILGQRNINGANVSVSPANIEDLDPGELFTVTVTAPSDQNAIAIFGLFASSQIEAKAVVMKESETF